MEEQHKCERCGDPKSSYFRAFEVESWGDPEIEKQNKEGYYLCFTCFNKIAEAPIQTEEVQKRLKENMQSFEKAVQEGLVCPKCKQLILDDNHVCEVHV
jgi:hypothetical protein